MLEIANVGKSRFLYKISASANSLINSLRLKKIIRKNFKEESRKYILDVIKF